MERPCALPSLYLEINANDDDYDKTLILAILYKIQTNLRPPPPPLYGALTDLTLPDPTYSRFY